MKKKSPPIITLTAIAISLLIISVYIFSRFSVSLSDFVNSTASAWFRRFMATLTSSLPFSLFEIVIYSLVPIVIAVILFAVRAFRRGRAKLFLLRLTSALLLIYSGHLVALGFAYNTTTLQSKLSLTPVEVTEERLASAMITLRDEANALAPECDGTLGYTSSGYTLVGMSEKICDSYATLSDKYSFIPDFYSNVKGVGFSTGLSYLGLTGIYTYYTGEANVNTQYPDYKLVFTSAHELAHQRGILRENEANFMAYLVLRSSDDQYLRYSAALNMYQYVASALYSTNRELYYDIASGLCDSARLDIRRSSEITLTYGDTFIADISDFVNDLFLKSNGTEGVVSYGLVVRLTLSYLEGKES